MRKSYNSNFLFNEQNKLIGINFGSNFCAEHEWGISNTKRSFGVSEDPKLVGIDRRRITTFPDSKGFVLIERKQHWTLVYSDSWAWRGEVLQEKFDSQELGTYSYRGSVKDEIYTAWSDGDFAVRVYSDAPNADKNKKHLKEIYDAIVSGDAALWLGGSGNPFKNSGLIIAIVSRCPEEGLKGMKEADEEANRLDDEFDRLNKELDIENRLKEAGKRYFALSPRFHGGNWGKKTVFDIIFWLNPMDQRNNRSGWVTVEDILAWADGKGPIPEDGSRRKGDYAGSFTEHEHVQKGVFGKKKQ